MAMWGAYIIACIWSQRKTKAVGSFPSIRGSQHSDSDLTLNTLTHEVIRSDGLQGSRVTTNCTREFISYFAYYTS